MEEMTFTKAIGTCFKKSFDFSGRARRSEYWYFSLFCALISIPILILTKGNYKAPLYIVWNIIIFFPTTAVSIRRLHDTGKSGFIYLIALVFSYGTLYFSNSYYFYYWRYRNSTLILILGIFMIVFGIIVFVFLCSDSEHGTNKYGDSPKYPSESQKYNAANSLIKTFHDEQKSIIREYIESQLKNQSFEDIENLQEAYFDTPHLSYMQSVIPNAKQFTSLEEYKKALKNVLEEGNEDKKASSENIAGELQSLKELFEKGLIDEEEYKLKKAQILHI